MPNSLLDFDKQLTFLTGAQMLVGIDEAGRGPLAGPVVACACFIPPSICAEFTDVNDSKKLTPKKREEICARLERLGVIFGVGYASAKEIDRFNILQATFLAMRRAAQKFNSMGGAYALVDGPHPAAGLELKQQPVIDGDAKSLHIAAASIIAKVHRDRYMDIIDKLYPGYGFAGHKGYGTQKHLEALKKLGPCPEHRRTFAPVRNLLKVTLFP